MIPFIPTNILSLVSNPTVIIGILLSLVIVYFYISNNNLEKDLLQRESHITTLTSNIEMLKLNFKTCENINLENVGAMSKIDSDLKKYNKICDEIVVSKDKIIYRLRKEIENLKKPIDYETTQQVDKCVIKIKTKDEDENSTFNTIRFIGN